MKWSLFFLLVLTSATLAQPLYEPVDKDGDGWPEWQSSRLPGKTYDSPLMVLEELGEALSVEELRQELELWPASSRLRAFLASKLVGEESLEQWRAVEHGNDVSSLHQAAAQLYKASEWGLAWYLLQRGGDIHQAYFDILERDELTARLLSSGWKGQPDGTLRRDNDVLKLELLERRFDPVELGGHAALLSPERQAVGLPHLGLQLVSNSELGIEYLAAELAGAEGVKLELGKSVQGRAIDAYWFGGGPETVVFFGAFHGDEPESTIVCDKLVKHLQANPEVVKGKTVVVIPIVNPDGLLKGDRLNANGVDLNRNYPTENWNDEGEGTRYWGGTKPASEPETKVVMDVMERFKPARIVSIHCPYKCVNYDGPAEKLAAIMSEENGYKVEPSIGYPTPGSFGNFAGVEGKIPTITLELPPTGEEDVWSDNRGAFLRAIRGE